MINEKVVNLFTIFILDKSKKEKWRTILMNINLGSVIKKGLAELVAGLIPYKMARNRWRGILRYGPIEAIILLIKLHRNRFISPTYYLTICAIIKNEGPYLKEWIDWHLNLGVEKFYIYDNDSSDNTAEILAPYIKSGLVEYIFFPGMRQQLLAYDDCLAKHRLDARWIAVIDLDEFIVPLEDNSIPAFLKRFEDYPVVEVNWLIYGSGGAKKQEPGDVMQRFKDYSLPNHHLNRHIKSIINPRKVFSFIGCHEVARISGKAVDTHCIPIKNNFREREPIQDVIRINHYAVKSYEEFLQKRARGKAHQLSINDLSYFDYYDLNDLRDSRDYSLPNKHPSTEAKK